jgi:hypothetical protein
VLGVARRDFWQPDRGKIETWGAIPIACRVLSDLDAMTDVLAVDDSDR